MNSENVWIPWNERTNLNDWVLFMGGVREIYIYLGCISPEYLAEFEHCFAINYQKYIKPSIGSKKCCFSLSPFDVYPSDIQDKILLEYHLYKENLLQNSNDLLFKIYKYWYKQRELFEGLDKVRFERNCHSLFKKDSVLVTNDSSDSPAENLTAKPKRKKATKKETQKAADLIIDYFRNGNHRKFSLLIINKHLEKELGQKFDLSAKTFLGKVYAVLYYQKKKIPPRSWTVGKVEEAEKEVQNKLSGK